MFVSDLNTPLLRLSAEDVFTLRDACGGVHVFGGIGSGKTSGSGKMLAGAFLRAGMGGLVTVAKFSDIELWRRYCHEHGRASSLVIFDESEGFNFLAYELARQGMDGIGSVTECLMRVIEAAKKATPAASQRGGDPFWSDATRSVLRSTIAPLYSAAGSLSIADITRFITTAPASVKDVTDAQWQGRSFMYGVMKAAANHPKVPMERGALKDAIDYWSEEYPAIPEKTRGNIAISVTTVLDRFKHGRLARAFCGKTTVVPELSFGGAVIVLAMPTLTWNEDGIIAQQLFKYMWQRAVLSRNSLSEMHRMRPVFQFCDEAQETILDDFSFQSLCRDSLCCSVYLTQSLPTYYAKMGGDNPHDDAHALVGKFITHVYHSNGCAETNEYASRTIGKVMKRHPSYTSGSSDNVTVGMNAGGSTNRGSSSSFGTSHSYGPGQGSHGMNFNSGGNRGEGSSWGENRGRSTGTTENRGYSESMEYAIEPGDFGRILRTGGKANGNIVTGVWFQAGRVFEASGGNFLLERFAQ